MDTSSTPNVPPRMSQFFSGEHEAGTHLSAIASIPSGRF